jgi:hypothetical protein
MPELTKTRVPEIITVLLATLPITLPTLRVPNAPAVTL